MVFIKKTGKDLKNIVILGGVLGVGTAVEAKLAPAVPVFQTVAPIAAVAAPIIAAKILIRSVDRLKQPVQIRSLNKATRVIKATKRRGFL